MEVFRDTPRVARMAFLGAGMFIGLVLALPVRTGSVSCPPAREGRVNCLVQHAWAPALVKVALCLVAAYVLHELCRVRLPEAVRRWRSGERLARREPDHGREAILNDAVLAAANWGVVPQPRRRLLRRERAVAPAPRADPVAAFAPRAEPVRPPVFAPAPVVAAAVPEPAEPAPLSAWERLLAEATAAQGGAAPEPAPAPSASAPVAPSAAAPAEEISAPAVPVPVAFRALTAAERRADPSGPLAAHLRVIGADEARTRRLRGAGDSALAVALFSDVGAAALVADDLGLPAAARVTVERRP